MYRKPHIIKANKTVRHPLEWIFFDIESTIEKPDKGIKEQFFKLGWGLYYRFRANDIKDTEEYFYFDNPYKFWEWVDSKARNNSKLMLVAHNASFDFMGSAGFIHLQKLGWEMGKPIITSNLFIIKFSKGDKKIVLFDWLQIMRTSLKKIGDFIGVPKGDINFNTCSDIELKEYCKQDVVVLKEAVISWLKFLQFNDLGNFAITISGQSYNAFRHRFMNNDIYIHNHDFILELENRSYRGGRTEAFYIGHIPEEIYYLDINSMYPTVMENNLYPVKFIKYEHGLNIKELSEYLDNYSIIADISIKINEPAIGYKAERLLFPIGNFPVTVTTPELKYLIEHDNIKTVGLVAIYEHEKIFTDYVRFFYGLREDYKKQNNMLGSQLTKLFLNSLYGKFGQKVKESKVIGNSSEDFVGAERVYDIDNKENYNLLYYGGKIIKEQSTESYSYDSFPAVASHVTAFARMLLWNYIKIAGRENVYYSDTDSIMTNKTGYNNLKEYIHETKLGYLALENIGENVTIKGVKDYIFNDNVKIKGISKNDIKLSENRYLHRRIMKPRSMFRHGHDSGLYVQAMIKNLSREYKKGTVTGTGWVKPYLLPQGEGTTG